jgi:hypothetical protein
VKAWIFAIPAEIPARRTADSCRWWRRTASVRGSGPRWVARQARDAFEGAWLRQPRPQRFVQIPALPKLLEEPPVVSVQQARHQPGNAAQVIEHVGYFGAGRNQAERKQPMPDCDVEYSMTRRVAR